MNKFDTMIQGLQQDVEIPEEVHRKYCAAINNLPDTSRKTGHTFSKRGLWPMVGAATLAVGIITVSAAAYMQWSQGLSDGLQTTAEQRQTLEDKQMASFVAQSVTQGDVTITAQQSIADNYCAYLSFKVEGSTLAEGEEPAFSNVNLIINDNKGNYSGGWSGAFYDGLISGEDGMAVHADGTPLAEDEEYNYILEDGSLEYQFSLISDTKGTWLDMPIHVEFTDLGVWNKETQETDVIAEGTWSFDWTLTGSDEMKTCELNTSLEDSKATVLRADLSPISIAVDYEFPHQSEAMEITTENNLTAQAVTSDATQEAAHSGQAATTGESPEAESYIYTFAEPPVFTGFRMKDGTLCTGLADGASGGYKTEDTDVYSYTASLNRIVDVDQIESLLFIKSYPEGDAPLTKENLYIVPVQ